MSSRTLRKLLVIEIRNIRYYFFILCLVAYCFPYKRYIILFHNFSFNLYWSTTNWVAKLVSIFDLQFWGYRFESSREQSGELLGEVNKIILLQHGINKGSSLSRIKDQTNLDFIFLRSIFIFFNETKTIWKSSLYLSPQLAWAEH